MINRPLTRSYRRLIQPAADSKKDQIQFVQASAKKINLAKRNIDRLNKKSYIEFKKRKENLLKESNDQLLQSKKIESQINELLSELLAQSLNLVTEYNLKNDSKEMKVSHIQAVKHIVDQIRLDEQRKLEDKIKSISILNEKEICRDIKNFRESTLDILKTKLLDYIQELNFAEKSDLCCPILLDIAENPVLITCKDEKSESNRPHLFDAESLQKLNKQIDDANREFFICPLDRRRLYTDQCQIKLPIINDLAGNFKKEYDVLLRNVKNISTSKDVFSICGDIERLENSLAPIRSIIDYSISTYKENVKIIALMEKLKINIKNKAHEIFWRQSTGSIPIMIREMMKIDSVKYNTYSEFLKKIDEIRQKDKRNFNSSWKSIFCSPNRNIQEIYDAKDLHYVKLRL